MVLEMHYCKNSRLEYDVVLSLTDSGHRSLGFAIGCTDIDLSLEFEDYSADYAYPGITSLLIRNIPVVPSDVKISNCISMAAIQLSNLIEALKRKSLDKIPVVIRERRV